jgi:hypothetical protein
VRISTLVLAEILVTLSTVVYVTPIYFRRVVSIFFITSNVLAINVGETMKNVMYHLLPRPSLNLYFIIKSEQTHSNIPLSCPYKGESGCMNNGYHESNLKYTANISVTLLTKNF